MTNVMPCTVRIQAALLRLISVEAGADPRTVLKWFADPASVRGMVADRIRQTVARHQDAVANGVKFREVV